MHTLSSVAPRVEMFSPNGARRRVGQARLVEVDGPAAEVLGRVGVDGLVDSSMHGTIRLIIAIEVQVGERQALRDHALLGDRRHDLRPRWPERPRT
jgi:hypothetical protein